jgi:hypothetical protein
MTAQCLLRRRSGITPRQDRPGFAPLPQVVERTDVAVFITGADGLRRGHSRAAPRRTLTAAELGQ